MSLDIYLAFTLMHQGDQYERVVRFFDASLTRNSVDGFGLYLIPNSQDH